MPTSASLQSGQLPDPTPIVTGSRRRMIGCLVLATALLGVVGWQGGQRVPIPGESGQGLTGSVTTAAADDGRLRLGTFNIHGGKGTDGIRDLSRTAESLKGLDLVALNEVQGARLTGTPNQAEQLAERLGMQWLYAPTEERWWHDQFGNGLLSALTIRSWRRVPLPRAGAKSHRNLVILECLYEDQPLHVVLTHIERSHEDARHAQMQVVTQTFLALPEPAVLMGDLNTDASEPRLQTLLNSPGVHDPLAEAWDGTPPRRIDWILTRGLRGVDAAVVDSGASDHPAVWVELERTDD